MIPEMHEQNRLMTKINASINHFLIALLLCHKACPSNASPPTPNPYFNTYDRKQNFQWMTKPKVNVVQSCHIRSPGTV